MGTLYYKNGDVFKGSWNDNKKNGYGVMTYSHNEKNRLKYEGYYKDDQRHGNGKMAFKIGDIYDGEWKFNKLDGQGVFIYNKKNTIETSTF